MKLNYSLTLFFIAIVAPVGAQELVEDHNGAKLFQQCRSCHLLHAPSVETDPERTGPNLFGIQDRVVGAFEGFRYSKDMAEAGKAGEVWTAELLDAFLADPKSVYPKTKMTYSGMPDQADREALIEFLFTVSADTAAAHQDPPVAPEILAIAGDVDYGEYLSSSCVTCHQIDGSDQGIPSILNWPQEQFITAMHAYKNKHRDNPVMQQYAGALADDEIAALAAYFETIEIAQ